MKKIILPAIIAVALMSSCGNNDSKDVVLANEIDSVSYALGANMANNIVKDFSEANSDAFIKGFNDVLDSATMKITLEELQGVLQPFFQRKQQEAMIKQQQEAEKAAQEQFGDVKVQGEKFMEDNKSNPGVKVTASGLQYIVMKEGKGKQPTAESNVEVHYHGTTPDGTVFDSSVERGESITFNASQVIPGWTEGLQLMKEGAKFKFFIPQDLAYGANPRPGGPIKPFMPLVFEVELIKVVD
ncbi:MAG: FKBP-type peptidyl-prolyl cis-trans isomerase [Flavobacteriales bacterium]|nr:FKBP-type peptidyl-prolyl cis-trans isomerase [Flavobacteriales bacterium]MCL4857003.1 FKBP-type peptidyl-prolyl cis-trans isomerase [Flavobacteriales bacterium]